MTGPTYKELMREAAHSQGHRTVRFDFSSYIHSSQLAVRSAQFVVLSSLAIWMCCITHEFKNVHAVLFTLTVSENTKNISHPTSLRLSSGGIILKLQQNPMSVDETVKIWERKFGDYSKYRDKFNVKIIFTSVQLTIFDPQTHFNK